MIIIIAISTFIFINYKPKREEKIKTSLQTLNKQESTQTQNKEELLKVDIKGEVINPGIYSVSSTSRVIDVIEKAGGLTENANTTVINLSKKVTDEMVVIIYSNQEVAEFEKTKQIEIQVQEKCLQKDENALVNDACITTEATTTSKLSLNKASLSELQTLPGIGESKAKDIISYRETNGPFKAIEDIKNVSGIGDALFAKIKDYITV